NGNCVDGDLVKRTDREVVLRLSPGEISFRMDQVNSIEFVKMKTYNEPAVLLSKKTAPREPAATKVGEPTPPLAAAPDLSDTAEPNPAGISQEIANGVDQAIMVWKKSTGAERLDLSETLIAMGLSVAPYLEFLLEKRSRSTPLEPVALALVSLAEDQFIDLCPKLMNGQSGMLRQAATAGLAKAASARRMPLLLDAMEDSDPTVWKVATDAILKSAAGDADKNDLADQIASRVRTSRNNLGLVVALSRIGGRTAHYALWDLVNDGNETNRLVGLHGVGLMADPEDGPRVTALLSDRSESVRKQVCQTIGKMRYSNAAAELINLLQNSSEGLQKDARWALAQVTGKQLSDNDAWKEWWDNFGSQEERYK
ncbi:MAG: HEAT repeat domain-containing protein, partial [Acidobacteria bacterium]|nr:HEAT repeat domain-containing protein [Acidobacteriota bacterium]